MPDEAIIVLVLGGVVLLGVLLAVLTRPEKQEATSRDRRSSVPPGRISSAPAPRTSGVRAMRMHTQGFLRISQGTSTIEEPLPGSTRNAGEMPLGVWVDDEKTAYVVGKQYTGKPGPDDGAVWRRKANGGWSTMYVRPSETLHSIAGTAPDDIYCGTLGGVLHYNGTTWSFIGLPYPMMVDVFTDRGRVYARAFDDSVFAELRRGDIAAVEPHYDPRPDPYGFEAHGMSYRVFDRSTEIGEAELSTDESEQMLAELRQVEAAVRRAGRR